MEVVDVLFPFHKIDSFLYQAVSSLRNSAQVILRIIAIDDRPKDSPEISKDLFHSLDYEVVRTEGATGYGHALSLGSTLIKSEYVALMNSDDLISPYRFVKQIHSLSESDISITGIENISASGKLLRPITGGLDNAGFDPIFLALGAYGANATWCMRSSWWFKNAFFDSYSALDWRIAMATFKSSKVEFIPENLYFYRKHSGQVTRNPGFFKNLDIVETAWLEFLSECGIVDLGRDSFRFLAASFLDSEIQDWEEVEYLLSQISKSSDFLNLDLKRNFEAIIRRRITLALRSPGNLITMPINLKAQAFLGIPSLGYDLIFNRLKHS